MALPATDSFTRANANLGANWTTVTGSSSPLIVSNAVEPANVGVSDSVAFWNVDVFGNDQYSKVTAITANTDNSKAIGVAVRCSNSATTYYVAFARGPLGASATLVMRKVVATTTTTFSSVTKTINSGDILELDVSNTNLTALVAGTSQGTTTDSSITSGSAGLYCFVDAGVIADAVLDNWEGGNFTGSATTLVGFATLGNVPNATGQSNQEHLVYGVNSGRWFLFFIDAGDTTHMLCYVSSSNDLSSATWAAIGTGSVSSQIVQNGSTPWVGNEGRNFAVAYANLGATDVCYIIASTNAGGSANPEVVQAVRVTLTASVATWGSWASVATTGFVLSSNTPSGDAMVVSTTGRAWGLDSRLTSDRDTAGIIATNIDNGIWTPGWGATGTLDNSQAATVNSGALAALASGLVLGVVDNGAVVATTTNHVFRKSASATAWPALSAWSVITATTTAAQDKNDWSLCGVTTSDVHFVRRVTSTTFAHYRYNGTSWGSVINPPALTAGGGTAHLAASGIHLTTDGTSLWCFWIDTNASNSIRYAKWTSGGGWDASWSTLTTNTNVKNFLSGYQTSGNSQIGLIWVEGANPYSIVGAPLVLSSGAITGTASLSATARMVASINQLLLAVSDTSNPDSWVEQDDITTTTLFSQIMYQPPQDTYWIESPQQPDLSQYTTRLEPYSQPIAGAITLHTRVSKDISAGTIDFVVSLNQGVTTIQSFTHTNIGTTWTQFDDVVTNAITDWTTPFDVVLQMNESS